jgi:polysaccharide pyruvyl transferase WcaK-like protein
MLIAARTHATIAAYSTLVPVYALGYSIKARGIAKDLFGKELCVKSITEINSADALFECFTELEANRENMKRTLTQVIPTKKELAFAAGEALKEYI